MRYLIKYTNMSESGIDRAVYGFLVMGFLMATLCLFVNAVSADTLTHDNCLNNTIDEPQCKDCCDCLPNAGERKNCRDACATEDFSDNSDFITVDPPSVLGPDGDYSDALATGSEQACKTYCDESELLACGDRRYCRDACNDAFGDPAPDPGSGGISIDQAISDEAQLKTIAFSGLAFLTGDLCEYTFFPPGKVSDFFGFQYMRDIMPNGFGHNTEFAGRVSDSVLSILTEGQVQELVNLANTQAEQVDAYGYKRFVLIKAFRRLLENDLPDGATGLDEDAVREFTGDLYEIDAYISYARARVIGGIVTALTAAQKTQLSDLLDAFNTLFESAGQGGTIDDEDWPPASPVDLSGLTVADGRVLVSTFATQLFSWYLGSVEGDTYFCPERHGTYFGSFYMKDIPPITAQGPVTIDSNLTADMGQAFLEALDPTQGTMVTGLLDIQRGDLYNIVAIREEISEKLRPFMNGLSVDESEVLAMVRQYGEYEGAMMYHYATNFANVGNSLTHEQADTVMGIRLDYYEKFPDYQADPNVYNCSGAWLYASRIDMPNIMDTDFLFGVGDPPDDTESVVADGAEITLVADGFQFAEGPAADDKGHLYFSDITANRIYAWSESDGLSVFRENSGGANGLFLDYLGNLLVCEGDAKQVSVIDGSGNASVLAHEYDGRLLNEPNDLWSTPEGGVYFTDPVYNGTRTQDGEHVYYLSRKTGRLTRVIDDLVRPNGIVGTADGKQLYVTDHGDGKTYRYDIESDGTLSNKELFVSVGGDGMTLDDEGNVYLCGDGVFVYDTQGNKIEEILLPEQPTNVCFGGEDGHTLFITTRTGVYSLKMRVGGIFYNGDSREPAPDIKANGSDETLSLSQKDTLTITVSLDAEAGEGQNVDWWVCAYGEQSGWWSWVYTKGWVSGVEVCVQAPLLALSNFTVLEGTLSPDTYTFFFAVDDNADGNPDGRYMDSVQVNIAAP